MCRQSIMHSLSMLGDTDIQALDGDLSSIVRDNQQHHDNIQGLLHKFQGLLDSYNLLKSDYEEVKEAREKYKRMARGQERNPFVLVLVDGDGYLFKDHLIRAGAEGGITAANILSDYVKDYLQSYLGGQADQCRVMVRIYANVLGLSKSLARVGLCGNEARSLSHFTASFTRSEDLFDYVDAGDKKEGADHKIREMFRLFADNNQCKHIFFAGCHDAGYLSLLTPYRGKADRITLIKGASFHREYESLNLPVWKMPLIFMPTSLGAPNPPTTSRPVCKHFQKGICKYGSECTKVHIMPSQHLSVTPSQPHIKGSNDTFSNSWVTPIASRSQEYYAKMLPPMGGKSDELIAVNKDGERIDTYFPAPSNSTWESYQRRAKRQKICNKYHLGGECGDMSCEFDHSYVDPSMLNVMGYILRGAKCPRGGKCRSIKCYTGHHCQKDGCRGSKGCRFGRRGHTIDLHLAEWILPADQSDGDSRLSPTSDLSPDSGSMAEEVSALDMSRGTALTGDFD